MNKWQFVPRISSHPGQEFLNSLIYFQIYCIGLHKNQLFYWNMLLVGFLWRRHNGFPSQTSEDSLISGLRIRCRVRILLEKNIWCSTWRLGNGADCGCLESAAALGLVDSLHQRDLVLLVLLLLHPVLWEPAGLESCSHAQRIRSSLRRT